MEYKIYEENSITYPGRDRVSTFKRIIRIMLGICCLAIGNSACVKTEAFLDDRQLLFVISPSRSGNMDGYNLFSEEALTAPDSSFYPNSSGWSFPVGLLRAAEKDVQVNAVIDTALIRYYDRIKITGSGVNSPALPEGAFELIKSLVIVKAGALISVDSVKMKVMNVPGLDRTQRYIVPVRISSPTEISAKMDTLRETLFFVVPFRQP